VSVIARGTPGFSGADLANLVNEAALLAARRGNRVVTMAEFEQSKDKVLMGLERRSLAMSEKEKCTTAYHEAGHALVTFYTPGSDPLHKVTIVPRGRTLGVTMSLPERDRYGFAKCELEAKLAAMSGGRVAEELVFGPENVTTGAADDIRQATDLARRMVAEYGFSAKLGPLNYADGDLAAAALPYIEHSHALSEATAKLVDEEIRRLAEESRAKARAILSAHMDKLHTIAKALLEHETLTGAEIRTLLHPEPAVADNVAEPQPAPFAKGSAVALAAMTAPR
jgi:cell division protease FtsH